METTEIKNDNGTYQLKAFQKSATHFLIMWPPMENRGPVAADHFLLGYMHSGKKTP